MKKEKLDKKKNKTYSMLTDSRKGITLIALIITIIVLLILVAITLGLTIGNNGLLEKSSTSKDESNKTNATETMNLKITNAQIIKYAEEKRMPTLKELADNFCNDEDFEKVEEKTETASLTPISNENPTAIITKLKAYPYEFEIDKSLQLASIDGVQVTSSDKGNGFSFGSCNLTIESDSTMTVSGVNDLKLCVVVKDDKWFKTTDTNTDQLKASGNFYVIAVDGDINFYRSNTVSFEYSGNATMYKDSDGKTIAVPPNFTFVDENPNVSSGAVLQDTNGNQFVWIPVENYTDFINDNDFKKSGYSDNTSEANYQSMIKSIQQYGGFYIGRYEAGQSNPSKRNEKTFINANKTNAQNTCNNYSCDRTKITPSVMYGVQYDAVLRYIKTYASTYNLTNSYSWGNYDGNSKTFTGFGCLSYGGNTWPSYTNQTETYLLLGTGLIERFKVLNIYDLAGNIIEVTLENSGVGRGGGHQDNGQGNSSASGRMTNGRWGFRYAFYINSTI